MAESAAIEDGRALLRLVRFVLPAPVAREEVKEGALVLVALAAPDGSRRTVAPALLDEAVSRGLIVCARGMCHAGADARAFLRRALADPAGDRFYAQHAAVASVTLAEGQGGRRTVRRNLEDTPFSALTRLKDKGGGAYFARREIEAGERLAADFERGGLQPRITARWEPRLESRGPAGRGAGDLGDSALSARLRLSRAVAAMGPDLSGVALDVCCFTKGLETVERERQWPARSAKLMLRTALAALARHYDPPRRAGFPPTRHWGADDYRPALRGG